VKLAARLPIASLVLAASACAQRTAEPPGGHRATESARHAAVEVQLASSAIPPAGSASSALATGPLCPAISASETDKALNALTNTRAKLSQDDLSQVNEPAWLPRAPVGFCADTESGAWLVSFKAATYENGDLTLRLALEHVDRAGRRASIVPTSHHDDDPNPKAFNMYASSLSSMVVAPSLVTMHGQEVVFWSISGHWHEDASFSRGRLFALNGGRITPYEPAKDLLVEELIDFDGDNHLDVVTFGPYDVGAESCASGFGYRISGPQLLAHQLADGTFSMTDTAAQAFAKKSCPKPPSKLLVMENGYPDMSVASRNVACSALWGATKEAVGRKVRAECAALPPTPSDCSQACDLQTLLKAAQTVPPLTIGKVR